MRSNKDNLVLLVSSLDDREADLLVENLKEIKHEEGFEHDDMCALFRPHSHSADCDCGQEELSDKIGRYLYED